MSPAAPVGPAVDRAVSDDPGADTRGDLDHHERIAVGELAVMFAQRHRVGIVVDQGGAVESGCEPRPDREPVPARHDRPADHGRACEIHWAWHREADDRRNVATVPPEQQCRRLTGDFQAFFGALVDIGYRGPLTLRRSRRRSSRPACPTTWPSGEICGTTAPTLRVTLAVSSTTDCAPPGDATRRDRNSAHGHGGSAGPRCDRAGR